ncbi:MAG TPA: hypothetical protein VD862_00400 [Candidatus Paceibacterota bacterium]|nr:hypothetical protein [Candidatus Paceibacterota bacterium]
MEKSPEQPKQATREEVIRAFRSGERQEGHRLFDEWYQRRIRDNDNAPDSGPRHLLSVETIEVYAAAGEMDMLMLEMPLVRQAIDSDATLTDELRTELAGRLDRAGLPNRNTVNLPGEEKSARGPIFTQEDTDFTTYEGATTKDMLNHEADRAVKQRESGDPTGAVTTLERARSYAAMRTQVLLELARKEQDPERKNAFLEEVGEIEVTDKALEFILKEFRG